MKDSERRAEEKTSVETSSLLKALANHNEKPEDVEAAFCHSEGETIRCSFEDLLKRELNPLKKSAPIIVFTKSRIYFSFFYEYFNRILSVPRNPENVNLETIDDRGRKKRRASKQNSQL